MESSVTPPQVALHPQVLDDLRHELQRFRVEVLEHEQRFAEALTQVAAVHRASARNLVHYMALRRHDIRDLQSRLAQAGLSSLGRSESHVLVTLDRVLGMLALARGEQPADQIEAPPVGFREGDRLLASNAASLLGPARPHRAVRIVVTMPEEAASDAALVRELLIAGMDCARINCAHDSEAAWGAMIENIVRARSDLAVGCKILMDLRGPKLRTGSIRGGKHAIRLRPGDRMALVLEGRPRLPRRGLGPGGAIPEVVCDIPEIFHDSRQGESIWFDDGKIGGVIESKQSEALIVLVTRAGSRKGKKLRAARGINLPDSSLQLPALSKKDLRDLPFICRHADLVALSFAQRDADVLMLQQAMHELGADRLGLILKIETRLGFENLPALLLAGMRSTAVGVMIARGDLAVESGFERLAEVQEEILWVAEAAHTPTIWATQVLELLAKKRVRSRAEVTDAAMSGRAEAVLLNKGPYLVEAIHALDDILARMQAHQAKKRSLLRPLHISENF
jgi:pyruvate kinase